MLLRASLVSSLVVVGACVLGGGCGGAVAPIVGGDGGSSSGGSSSGGGEDGGTTVPETGAPIDSAITVDAPMIGPCEPDGVPCSFPSQCCTAICAAGVCGGSTPTCTSDGDPCQSSMECCSGFCSGNVCQEQTMTTCGVSSNANPCDVCLANTCCAQLSACESSPACLKGVTCFDSCYTGPGTGANCASKCGFSSTTQGAALEQCAVSGCINACE